VFTSSVDLSNEAPEEKEPARPISCLAESGKMAETMTELMDKQWNNQYEKLVEFKRTNDHCLVPQRYAQDKSLGTWGSKQRTLHAKNNIRQNRKDLLDKIEFAWRVDLTVSHSNTVWHSNPSGAEKKWHEQYEKLVEFERKNGHCLVPLGGCGYKQTRPLGMWVHMQRSLKYNNKLRPDRKKLLDKFELVWKADTLAARRSSTTDDGRGLVVIGSFHPVLGPFSLSFLCLIYV
jgi:hypothetical protein